MYESEANRGFARASEIPSDVLAQFSEARKTVTSRTLIPWSEHCTECVWPTCYSTCDLYSPRMDGRCRRFVEGMVRVDTPETLNGYLLKISFKRWAKLWSPASLAMYSAAEAARAERADHFTARCIQALPNPSLERFVSLKRYSIKKRRAMNQMQVAIQPDCFLVECYNPNVAAASLTVIVRREDSRIPFQALLAFQPGFNRHRIGFSEIARVVDLAGHFQIELAPNDNPEGLTLYFGAMDFVTEKTIPESRPAVQPLTTAVCKCVIWDLDNTLWEGVLVEDGPEKVRLKPDVVEILKELDQRGILLSIASKNTHEDAMALLRQFTIDEYFLFPQICWKPKSQGIREIATSLNIGLDSLLFIDDSPFERAEVKSTCPDVMTLDATEYRTIPARPDCHVPVTEESRKRRAFYHQQQQRQIVRQDFQGEYVSFLRDCNLRLTIRPMTPSNLERVHELTQRTNQMNFSGNRYSRELLQNLLVSADVDTYVVDCEDRFGSYGTIGFCLVKPYEACITDLMFSCRIQGKRVEHAFVSYLIRRYRRLAVAELSVNYRKTKKNGGPGQVFNDLGFQAIREVDGVTRLFFPGTTDSPDEGIIAIEDTAKPAIVSK
jgi:FkbH-like protein